MLFVLLSVGVDCRAGANCDISPETNRIPQTIRIDNILPGSTFVYTWSLFDLPPSLLSETEPDAGEISTRRNRHRIFHDIGHGVSTVVSDAGYVYSSPARINRRSALWLGGIVAVGGLIYVYDREIYDAINRNKDESILRPINDLGKTFSGAGYMGSTNKYFLGALALGYLVNCPQVVRISAEILESQFMAGAIKDAANVAAGRARPYADKGPRYFKFNEGTSFPSGHAKNVLQIANVISHRTGFLPLQIVAYTVASAVCLERVSSGSHWPSDVYAGAVYGWIISNELLKRHDRRIDITPVGDSEQSGLIVSFRF